MMKFAFIKSLYKIYVNLQRKQLKSQTQART